MDDLLDPFTVFTYNMMFLRRKYDLSKKVMAGLLGIGMDSLRKIERGVFPPRLRVSVFFEVQRHFGIRVSDLLSKKLVE